MHADPIFPDLAPEEKVVVCSGYPVAFAGDEVNSGGKAEVVAKTVGQVSSWRMAGIAEFEKQGVAYIFGILAVFLPPNQCRQEA